MICVSSCMRRLASVAADSGYEQYEISNFSKPGMHSRHNSSYWDFTPYLGLGASAHSFDGTVRRFNPSDLRRYMSDVRRCGSAYTEESETLSELYNEWVMTRLRTKWGLDLQELAGRFGKRYSDVAVPVIAAYETSGCLCRSMDTVRLTRKGVMLSDAIFRDLFVVD